MNVVRRTLPLVHLSYICFQIVSALTRNWLEDVTRADVSYSPALLTTTASSLVFCLALCSKTVKCKAAIYNKETGVCLCFDNKRNTTSKPGNRLWNSNFEGFTYDARSDFHIRLFTDTKKTQADAGLFCNNLGARLAVLDTNEKFNYVRGLLVAFPGYEPVYVGATDPTEDQTEGLFVWSTGANITGNWAPNEPNNANAELEEDCVDLYISGFNDCPCDNQNFFACEFD